MASFGVTAVATQVSLDAQRRGLASFTVTNTTDQPRRGRAQVVPLEGADAAWFTVVGDAARSFQAGATEQYPVQIAVPATVPAGRHSFRLDAVAEENPDEDTAAGPTVAFEVPAPGAPPKRRFPWWIVAIVLVVLIGAGIAVALIASGGDDDEPVKATPTTAQPTAPVPTTDPGPPPPRPIEAFGGNWVNPDSTSRGVDRIAIEVQGDSLRIAPDGCSKVVRDIIERRVGGGLQVEPDCRFDAPVVPFAGEPVIAPVNVSARIRVAFMTVNVDVRIEYALEFANAAKDRLRVTESRGDEKIAYTLDKQG